jgi:hypothetical protein
MKRTILMLLLFAVLGLLTGLILLLQQRPQ